MEWSGLWSSESSKLGKFICWPWSLGSKPVPFLSHIISNFLVCPHVQWPTKGNINKLSQAKYLFSCFRMLFQATFGDTIQYSFQEVSEPRFQWICQQFFVQIPFPEFIKHALRTWSHSENWSAYINFLVVYYINCKRAWFFFLSKVDIITRENIEDVILTVATCQT